MSVKRTERGWAGHFLCAQQCLFRRNTLLQRDNRRIVVSTVGAMWIKGNLEAIGANGRYYETMAFKAKKNGQYWYADVSKQLSFESKWAICATSPRKLPQDVDNKADQMHEAVVAEFIEQLERDK